MKKDLIITFATQFLILAISLLVYRFVKIEYSDIGFSTYALFKRSSGYINSFLLMGVGVALPRQIALELGEKKLNSSRLLTSAIMIILFGSVLLFAVGFIFRDQMAFLLFGERSYSSLIIPLLLVVMGLLFQTIIYGYFRGFLRMQEANVYQFISLGIVPIIAFILSNNVANFFYYQGTMSIFFFLTALIYIRKELILNVECLFKDCKKLWNYGIQRMPGDFALGSLLSLPAILVTHDQGVLEAGYVAFGVSLLNMVGQVFGPIGLVFLPKISRLIGEQNFSSVRVYALKLFTITLIISIFGVTIFELFSTEILNVYLDQVELKLNETAKAIMFAGVFYSIYVTMRSIVDASYKKAYNTISVIISLVTFFIIYFLFGNVVLGLNIAVFIIAGLTLFWLKHLFVFKKSRIKS